MSSFVYKNAADTRIRMSISRKSIRMNARRATYRKKPLKYHSLTRCVVDYINGREHAKLRYTPLSLYMHNS